MKGDIAHCELCGIDFVQGNANQRFCKTRQCKADRHAEEQERQRAKLRVKEPYHRVDSPNPTVLQPNAPSSRGRRQSRRRED